MMNVNNIKYTFPRSNTPYKINIKLDKTVKLFDSKIYSLKRKLKLYQFGNIKNIRGIIASYLCNYPQIKSEEILTLKFNNIIGLELYILCYKYITKQKNRCLLFVKNLNMIDVIYYLYTYVLQIKPIIIVNIITITNAPANQELEDYCKKQNIKYDYVNTHNTENIHNIEPTDFIIIDYIPSNSTLNDFKGIFQPYDTNNLIILGLKRLVKGGTMFIYSTLFTNLVNFQYYIFLSYFFEKITFKHIFVSNIGGIFIICYNYKGNIDMQPLLDLEDVILKYNPNRYMNIKISDTNAIDILNKHNINIPKELINDGTYMHITNFMDIDLSLYKKFKAFQTKHMETNIYNIAQYKIHTDGDNLKLFLEQIKLESILIAKKYKLPLKDWVYVSKELYNNKIADEFSNLMTNYNYTLEHTKNLNISKHDKISIHKYKIIKNILRRVKFSYNYVEQYNKSNFESIELWFNNRFKKLNTYLFQQEISTNGHKVSRGWTKMYEMLFDMKILEKCSKDKKINIFHTCEAPGNFINAISHYMKTHMSDINHLWKSQSLKTGLTDQYGFMEKTKEFWDYGLDNSGDIINNFSYYYEKYINCDMYISDCGQGWTNEKDKLGLIQLIYALLLPRIGGGFIIKIQNCAFLDKIEISLLYVITNKYKNVNICRSNANFWSSEIYITGYDKQEITKTEREVILNCINNKDYPVEKIKSKFITAYCDVINKYISQAISFRTYFLFLSENKKIFNANKQQYETIISKYIQGWIEKYII